jgi:hypothetical protein
MLMQAFRFCKMIACSHELLQDLEVSNRFWQKQPKNYSRCAKCHNNQWAPALKRQNMNDL